MSNLRYVDTLIGTRTAGNTLPGAFTPWGVVSVCPHTEAGYGKYADDAVYHGFGHVHLSGAGGSCLGGVIVAAATGHVPPDRHAYGSPITRERPGVGVYGAHLTRWGIDVDVTATPRTGLTRLTLPGGPVSIFLDLAHSHSANKGGMVRRVGDDAIEGWKEDGHFCGTGLPHRVYFAARLCGAGPVKLELWTGGVPVQVSFVEAPDAAAVWRTSVAAHAQVFIQVGISHVSTANAWENLAAEQPAPDFTSIAEAAARAWEHVLGRIEVEGGTDAQRTMFYTALYHACLHPNILQDVNGEYPAMGSFETRTVRGRDRYSVYSLWDTHRTLVPLYALLFPERLGAMTATLLDMQSECGFLPKWELYSNETFIMPGDPSLPAIADAWLRGVRGFDIDAAYAAMKHNADWLDDNGHSNIRPGLAEYLQYGYVPHDLTYKRGPVWTTSMKGSVSYALEYYVADASLARLATALGRTDDAARYNARAAGWRKLFDPASGCFRPRNADGSWVEPFDPMQVGGGTWDKRSAPGFVEGNGWIYNFYVPHAMPELVAAMGGPAAFSTHLQRCFDEGHYDGTNEPDMAYPFLFNYADGEAWRTQKTVRACIDRYWGTGRDGIPGDEDCGTLSAWLVFAMLGLYPDCPAKPSYQISAPVFERATLHPEGGQPFVIERQAARPDDWRITGMTLNGQPWTTWELPHDRIATGGSFQVSMSGQTIG